MINITPTPLSKEEIARHYNAALDSVNLINGTKPEFISEDEWDATIERNKAHLRIMLAKDYWTTEDLSPLEDAAQ
jgi:hypothetical protein